MRWPLDATGLAALLLLPCVALVHADKPYIAESGAWIQGADTIALSPEPSPLEASVPADHLFARNQRIDASFDNPSLLRRLYNGLNQDHPSGGRRSIVKRAPSTVVGPMITAQHCLGCAEKDAGTTYTIGDLDTPFLQGQALFSEGELESTCVFYTGVRDADKANNPWINNEPDQRTSRRASNFACANRLQSIWTVFPGRHANTPSSKPNDPATQRNMFEVKTQGSWLNFLDGTQDMFTYFENMSRAMANLCSGIVYVMSPDPKNIHDYGSGKGGNNDYSIWNNLERPTLRDGGRVSIAYAVDATDPSQGWEVDLQTGKVKTDDPVTLRFINPPVRKRDICGENTDYEPLGEDWFGTGSRI